MKHYLPNVYAITFLLLFTWSTAFAAEPDSLKNRGQMDGVNLVVPKGAVQGTVNGTAAAGEYFTTVTVGAGTSTAAVQTYRDPLGVMPDEMQLFITINDNTNSGNDDIQIQFDLNHNHVSDAGFDREIRIRRNGTTEVGGLNTNGPPDAPVAFDGARVNVASNAGNWVVEIKILPVDLNLNEIPTLFGFSIQAFNNDNLTAETYPNANLSVLNNWANVETRYDIDYMIVLDKSGSMLSDSKWDNALQAANFFANTMSILRHPEFGDRAGLVTFNWPCTGGSTDATSTPLALAPVGSFPVGDYTASVSDPISNNCTPIGEGLKEAFSATQLNASQNDDAVSKRRGVLLLSDGLHNREFSTLTLNNAQIGYAPCGAALGPCANSNVPVSTVAFGEGDWGVDTDLLSDLQTYYSGALSTTTTFNLSSNPDDLKESFIQGLEDFYTTNMVAPNVSGNYDLLSGNEKFIAIASWAPGTADAIKLQRNDGGFTDVPCSISATDAGVGFSICAINFPAGGEWRVRATDGSPSTATRIFAVVDLRLRAKFASAPAQPETGEKLLLTAQLLDRGQPVLHDPVSHPVAVTVHIEKPGESVGTFASTVQPRTCDIVRPTLPNIDPINITDPSGPPVFGSTSTGIRAMAVIAQVVADPHPPLFSLVGNLLSTCRQGNALPRLTEPGLPLFDDGTHGDITADDGVYSLAYDDTQVEGTYVFRFTVHGKTADGESFARTNRQAAYVRIHVDPQASDLGDRVVSQAGNVIVKQYYILPRDQFYGYMGPGKAHKVDFVLTAGNGTFLDEVTDIGNGYYTRRLQYDASQGTPEVTTTVYGNPVVPTRRPLEFHLMAGATFFDDALQLKDGLAIGVRLGYGLTSHLVLEAEGAVTFSETQAGVSGKVFQVLGNLRYDVNPASNPVVFLTAGGGYVLFRDFGVDDEAVAYHAGGGLTYWLNNKVGLRGDFRVFRYGSIFTIGETTNYQATGAIIFKL